MQETIDAVIDWEVSVLDRAEIAGAWRSICAMMLLRTAKAMTLPTRGRKVEAGQKRAANEWISGSTGIVTFQQACEALGLDPVDTKEKLKERAASEVATPIKKANPQYVFGKANNDYSPESSASCPVGAGCR